MHGIEIFGIFTAWWHIHDTSETDRSSFIPSYYSILQR
jgi:hypothetical protein